MSFTITDDLAPELYPLAWLVGQWRGPGALAYPGIDERGIVAEISVTHDGGPYLAYDATLRLGEVPDPEADFDPQDLTGGEIWARESGYWRPATGVEALPVAGAPADGPSPSPVEMLVTDPSGFAAVMSGSAQGPRIDLVSDWVAATASSTAEVRALRRMYGWVRGTIFWAYDLAAFGQELQSYASGRLARIDA